MGKCWKIVRKTDGKIVRKTDGKIVGKTDGKIVRKTDERKDSPTPPALFKSDFADFNFFRFLR